MLLNLHVKNLAIIDEIEVDFAGGLNVLTGETGAGKSIIIGSINLALGGKAAKDVIRKGAEFALVELTFSVEKESDRKKIEELGVSVQDGVILISRKILPNRTVSRINGETVTVSVLRRAAGFLIDIHGQNEQQSLLYKEKHLEILNRYAREEIGGRASELAEAYQEYKRLSGELAKQDIPEEERLRELSFLQFSLEEIRNANLVSGEEEQLSRLYRKLSNASETVQGLSDIYRMTSGESGSVSEKIAESIRILSRISSYDERAGEFLDQLSDIDGLVTDFNRDISDYIEGLDLGQEELEQTEKRLDLVRSIKAKYGATTAEVLEYAEQTEEKIKKYEEYDTYREELKVQKAVLEERLEKLSSEVSEIRKGAAKRLECEIAEALADLNFLQVQFAVEVRRRETIQETGIDEVEFMLSANPGEGLRPLGAAASGGELSRIMLAVKAVLAEHDEIDTMIFDEIDVGISGRTAQKVAEKMSLIGKTHQVICISHLAQIAAMADTQYLIEKENEPDHTQTTIRALNEEESVSELARILGGAKITDAVFESAREMKELAMQLREKR